MTLRLEEGPPPPVQRPRSLPDRTVPPSRSAVDDIEGSAPLSFAQLQMWVMDQMMPGNPAYELPVGYRLRGRLNVPALEASFNEMIRRHAVLRTTFTVQEGEPLQLIHRDCIIRIQTISLEGMERL